MSICGVELFAGGGGLLLGAALAGVRHEFAVERDRWACDTLMQNAASGYPLVRGLKVLRGDIRSVDWSLSGGQVDLVAGGPPCQPFSLGGKARAADDARDMFPTLAEAIAALRPRAFVVENVRGLTRQSFHDYYSYVKLRLAHPQIGSREGETWREHAARLEKEHTSGAGSALVYNLVDRVVDAADYGVPQRRHRVFIVGFRSDVRAGWAFPAPTHSGEALRLAQVRGDYFERHRVRAKDRIVIRQPGQGDPDLLPWRTVRDALDGMPEPMPGGTSGWLDHRFQPGARSYPGHTGSPVDEPSKALKAGGHGVPGGENMLRRPDGSIRYYSVREAARIQTFPDEYALRGSWGEAMRQIGNAVPVLLAKVVMSSVARHLEQDSERAAASPRLRAVS
jgi:DNA (cytosine-5)-methyltransferase 1